MTRLCLALAACLVPLSAGSLTQTPASAALVGVWGSENVFGPSVRGELTIDARRPEWRAKISGYEVPVRRDRADGDAQARREDAIAFSLPGDTGEFRGRVSARGVAVTGDWIQPGGTANNNRYATPVHFSQGPRGVWTGRVDPLDDRVSFYLSIRRAGDGSLTAFIRNPDYNYFRRRLYRVDASDGRVTLTNAERADDRMTGAYGPQGDRLSLPALSGQPPLEFTRRAANAAAGLFPRARDGAPYAYHKPQAADDGWPTAALADVGMDSGPLRELVEKILTADVQDNPVNIHSLLVARHGKLVFEEYFYGYDRHLTHDTRSASKTYGPVLVGIARDRGANIGPDTPVYEQYAAYRPFDHWDARKDRLTLRHLMTMTSGLACDDNDDSSPGQEDNMQEQRSQPDWYKYTLDLPVARDPGGEKAIYCSAGMNLIGGVVKNATGTWLPEFFDAYLARPLQFGTYHMNLTPTGEAYLGGGLAVRPRDEIKLGQLYLSRGLWNARRVVSSAWVEDSTASHSNFAPMIEGDLNHQYGYGWHINPLKTPGHTYRSFSAGGNGGQIVMVIPELDMVVAFNGGSYGEFSKWYRWSLELVPQYIIPAVNK
ncbi:MAG TPA: serine hydrolase [Vicinamibacterales bacterium]|jgi:CubicO group peptidase (beta-lactamase class C family)|nr:serine hydrolase [Vicinamibacterales bacterium]